MFDGIPDGIRSTSQVRSDTEACRWNDVCFSPDEMTLEQRDLEMLPLFRAEFGSSPRWIARAPGRVNLIGEHTDYNDGLVMPMAIDRDIQIWFSPRDDSRIRLVSQRFSSRCEFDGNQTQTRPVRIEW